MRRPGPVAGAAALVPQRHPGGRPGHRRPAGARRGAGAAAHALRPDQAGPRRRPAVAERASTGWAPTSTAATCCTRLVYGARIDLRVGFLAVLIPFVVGSVLGALAGYFGGWFDTIVMRVVDVFFAFPFYVLVIVLVFVLGAAGEQHLPGHRRGLAGSSYAKIMRGELLVAKKQDCVRRRPPRRHVARPDPAAGTSRRTCSSQAVDLRDERHRHGHHGDRHPGLSGPGHRPADRPSGAA